jgi:hypothetical protein
MMHFRPEGVPLTEEQKLMRKRVLAQIENEPGSFDMDSWEEGLYDEDGKQCGTTRCIAGWAVYFAEKDGRRTLVWDTLQDGISLLGLTRDEFSDEHDVPLFYDTNYRALERLRELASGGEQENG